MRTLFDFIDYRAYLRHFYDEKKKTFRAFSHRYFLSKAGINSSSFLKHVIEGRRNLTPETTEKFASALGLTPKETRYFSHLVMFNQARTAQQKQEHYAVLRSMIGGVAETVVPAKQFDYYNNWYTSIIRELVCIYDFKDDLNAIARAVQPPVKTSEVRNALKLLLDLGMLKKLSDGRYEQTSRSIVANDAVTSLGLRSFVGWMSRYTESALSTYSRYERSISSVTLGVSEATYQVLAAEIEAFKDRVKTIVNHDIDATRVYQFNISLFPMSSDLSRKDSISEAPHDV